MSDFLIQLWYSFKRLILTKRDVKFAYQRYTRGWDDSETWNLSRVIAEFVLPRLKRYKEINNGYPIDLTAQQWDDRLDIMIEAFEYHILDTEDQLDVSPEKYERVKLGMEIFGEFYNSLGW